MENTAFWDPRTIRIPSTPELVEHPELLGPPDFQSM